MKFGKNVDYHLLRMSAERHHSKTRIAQDIGDQRSLDDKRRYAFREDFFRFRSFFDPQGVWGYRSNLA
jgi:hypothetical protein